MEKSKSNVFKLLNNIHFVQWVNQPTEESNHYWAKWIANHPESRKEVAIAKRIILSAKLTSTEPMSDTAYDRILENIINHSQNAKRSQSHIGFHTWKFIGLAASIILILGFAIYTMKPDPSIEPSIPVTIIDKQAPLGSRVTTKLPDGSLVTLNSGSQIIFSSEFGGDSREVILEGEAFFEISRDPEKPFYVKVNDNLVRVLGTSFNVRSYDQDEQVSVSVSSGVVSYTTPTGERVVLKKDEEAIYSVRDQKLDKGIVNRKQAFGWKDRILYFESNSLHEITLELERWYGVNIQMDKSIKSRMTYSGEFYNASLEEVLNGLSFVYRFEFIIQDGLVQLKNNNQTN